MSDNITKLISDEDYDTANEFLGDLLSNKVSVFIEVMKVELASTMFAEATGTCPECMESNKECECEEDDDAEEMDEAAKNDEDPVDRPHVPFGGPYRNVSKPRKDQYGNVIKDKNAARNLAKQGMAGVRKEEVEQMNEKIMIGDKVKIHHKGSQAHGMVGRVEDIYPDEGGTHAKVRISKGTSTSVPVGSLKRHKKVSEEVEQIAERAKWRSSDAAERDTNNDWDRSPKSTGGLRATSDTRGNTGGEYDHSSLENRRKAQVASKGPNAGKTTKASNTSLKNRIRTNITDLKNQKTYGANLPEEVEQVDEIFNAVKKAASNALYRPGNERTDKRGRNIDSRAYGAIERANTPLKQRIGAKIAAKKAASMVEQMDEEFVLRKGKRGEGSNSSDLEGTHHGVKVKPVYTDKKEAQAHADAINKGRGYKPGDEKSSLYGGVLYQVFPRKKTSANEDVEVSSTSDWRHSTSYNNNFRDKGKAEKTAKNLRNHTNDGNYSVIKHPDDMIGYRITHAYKRQSDVNRKIKNLGPILHREDYEQMDEAEMTDMQKLSALGMKGSEKARTMQALSTYRRKGDINKLSPGHRTLVAGYIEKTGGLGSVNRSAALSALKKDRMQEE